MDYYYVQCTLKLIHNNWNEIRILPEYIGICIAIFWLITKKTLTFLKKYWLYLIIIICSVKYLIPKCSAFFNEESNQDNLPPQASDADFWHQTSVKIAKSLHADSANIEESIALKDLIVVRGLFMYCRYKAVSWEKFVQFLKWWWLFNSGLLSLWFFSNTRHLGTYLDIFQ